MSDPWQEPFYAFERMARAEFEPRRPQRLGLNTCARLVDRVFMHFGRPYAPVRFSGGPGLQTGQIRFMPDELIIALPPCRRRPWAALHEAAHALTPEDDHGPVFASLCIKLWTAFAGWPYRRLVTLADNCHVALLEEEV